MTQKKFNLILWTVTLIIVAVACFMRFGSEFGVGLARAEYDYSDETITDIVVNADSIDLDIESGDTFEVKSDYKRANEPEVKLTNGKLEIFQKNKSNVNTLKGCKLSITIPSSIEINSADITTCAGDIDINGVKFGSLNVDADAGDIDIERVEANTFVISADAGDIDVSKSQFKTIQASADAGDIDFEDVSAENGTFDADFGSIDVDGDFDKITASCELGDIDIEVPDPSKVDFDLDCELGSIDVNGKSWHNN